MKRDINRFDTSDYSSDNAYDISLANKIVLGLMKNKNHGIIMTEFIGLRAKMPYLWGKKDSKKTKGVKSKVIVRSIMFELYAVLE